jgi:hypothetical protein
MVVHHRRAGVAVRQLQESALGTPHNCGNRRLVMARLREQWLPTDVLQALDSSSRISNREELYG